MSATESAAVENEIEISASPEAVFDYCTDMMREPEWNPRMRHVAKTTAGPIGVGTHWEAEFMKDDPMIVEYVQFDRPTAWESVGHSRLLDVKMVGAVSATGDGARLLIRTELRGKGVLRLLRPVLTRLFHKREERNLAVIKAALER